jgi:hypothetical protein
MMILGRRLYSHQQRTDAVCVRNALMYQAPQFTMHTAPILRVSIAALRSLGVAVEKQKRVDQSRLPCRPRLPEAVVGFERPTR